MVATAWPQSLTLTDIKGNKATIRYCIKADGGAAATTAAAAVATAIVACSNAALDAAHGNYSVQPTGDKGVTGAYSSIEDKLRLELVFANGLRGTLSIPAPTDVSFDLDHETWDADEENLAALQAALETNLCHPKTVSGLKALPAGIPSGLRTRSNIQRQVTSRTLGPHLDKPAL